MKTQIWGTLLVLSLLLALVPVYRVAVGQNDVLPSTSSTIRNEAVSTQTTVTSEEESEPITFSEFPLDTSISDQYADQGIVFGGDSPFVSRDGANPTSPVLSGTPLFRGDIEGRFVDPSNGETPIVVQSFSFDAGYFDELASTRIEWFDPDGNKLGQRTNSQFGIERLNVEGGNIASWRTSIIKTEPAGYAIDNVSFTPVDTSLLFRELDEGKKDGTWEGSDEQIPGFDHVGLHVDNLVYESHPGYPSGTYVSEDGAESVDVIDYDGVQAKHTRKTFEHDATVPGAENSPTSVFEEIPIARDLAQKMREKIQTQIDVGAKFLSVETLFGLEQLNDLALLIALFPESQKGGDNTFTCVGLVEWSAEQASHNSGQGFIPNYFEGINLVGIPGLPIFPLLSPALLNRWAKIGNTLDDANQWLHGGFDPVDFMITDPLGRQLGYIEALGEKNEMPNAFYTGNGDYEQFMIPNPVAGSYEIELVGVDKPVLGAIASRFHTNEFYQVLAAGERLTVIFTVEVQTGVPGDVNRDGCINQADKTELLKKMNTFANSLIDPADIDGNGIIEQPDLDLIEQLITLNVPCATPDLVVQNIIADEDNIQVVIQNQGTGLVPPKHDFWVDVYINPGTPPTAVNDVWDFMGEQGLVWGVVAPAVPMQPGATVTLSIGDRYYWPSLSNFSGSISPGTPIYAQVDSANSESIYGGVLESHESAGGAYNNIAGPVLSKGAESSQLSAKLYLPLITSSSASAAANSEAAPAESVNLKETLPVRP